MLNQLFNISQSNLTKLSKLFELDFDQIGNLRTLSSKENQFQQKTIRQKQIDQNAAIKLCKCFVSKKIIQQAFNISSFKLKLFECTYFAFGYRITFKQFAQTGSDLLPVLGGAIHIMINHSGKIISASSTIQQGKINRSSLTQISKTKTMAIAKNKCGKEIIATALVNTPDPNIPISDQISKVIIKGLPNNQILKDEHFEMFTGIFAKTVSAKDDNTYCYGPRDSQFAAVSIYIALKKQIELYLSLGLKPPVQPMFVFVDNPLVRDNAYFDPQRYEIHIGVGSGVKHGGLTKHIAFDLGVANHEFGHATVALQSVSGDLMGKAGAAIHEAVADVLGTLTMDYLGKIQQAKNDGKPYTAKDLKNDPRIIGKYALPPFGIRCQKNNKSTPDDLAGEPHADGLIIGGALADLLVAMATKSKNANLEKQIKQFVQIMLMALALLPGYRLTFGDLLRSVLTADKEICHGKHKAIIEKCFRDHGIVLNTIIKSTSCILLNKSVVCS